MSNSGKTPQLLNVCQFQDSIQTECGSDSAAHDAGRAPSMLRFQQGIPDRSVDDISSRVPLSAGSRRTVHKLDVMLSCTLESETPCS